MMSVNFTVGCAFNKHKLHHYQRLRWKPSAKLTIKLVARLKSGKPWRIIGGKSGFDIH